MTTKPLETTEEVKPEATEAVVEKVILEDRKVVAAPEVVSISKEEWDKVQEQLKMLKEVADKGRVFSYENQKAALGKKSRKVKLSLYTGKIVIGWATIKDVLVKNPTTGLTVDEDQQYELLLLGEDNAISKIQIAGYARFSNIRYNDRIEADVVSQSEDYEGKTSFDVKLPDGRVIKLASQFIN